MSRRNYNHIIQFVENGEQKEVAASVRPSRAKRKAKKMGGKLIKRQQGHDAVYQDTVIKIVK